MHQLIYKHLLCQRAASDTGNNMADTSAEYSVERFKTHLRVMLYQRAWIYSLATL
jgi:hypothetical protein